MSRRGRAFTMIELMIVVVIIVILAAVLFPTFVKAREKAKVTSCQSNLKQLSLALQSYVHDHDDVLLRSWNSARPNQQTDLPSAPGLDWKWMDCLLPYVRAEATFDCLAAEKEVGLYKCCSGVNYGSYVMNAAYWATPDLISPGGKFCRMSQATTPSSCVWVTDGDGHFENAWAAVEGNPSPDYSHAPPRLYWTVARHLNQTNVLYLDGHLKCVRLEALSAHGPGGVMPAWVICSPEP